MGGSSMGASKPGEATMCGYSDSSEAGSRQAVTIGAAALAAGLPADAIGHYERAGVVPRPGRCGAGHRQYRGDDLGRLRLVRRMRELGIPDADMSRLLWGS